MDESENKSFKINDRRRFNSEGEQKAEEVQEPKVVIKSAEQVKVVTSKEKIETEPSAHETSITISSFIMSLAMQALMQLGEIAPPAGADITKDKSAAKQTIDIISMLKEKTKGNLSVEENKMLEEVLHNLRISFVKA